MTGMAYYDRCNNYYVLLRLNTGFEDLIAMYYWGRNLIMFAIRLEAKSLSNYVYNKIIAFTVFRFYILIKCKASQCNYVTYV